MASTISTNMSLVIPTVGTQSGPQYATDINTSLNLIDAHDHTTGKGVAITPGAMDINTDIDMQENSLINATSLVFTAGISASTTAISLSAAPGGESTPQKDLWYTPDTGIPIQITKDGAVNATIGSLDGESYLSGTFTWTQSQSSLPTTPANFDIGSIILRPNTAATTYGVQLVPPSAISSQYSINLPSLPASQKIMTLDASGNMTAPYVVDNSTLTITSNTIKVATGGITNTQIADATITGAKLVSQTIGYTPLAPGFNGTWNSQTFTTTLYNGNTTSSSATITNISSTSGITVGQAIIGPNIPVGTHVLTIDSSTQITMTANATSSITGMDFYVYTDTWTVPAHVNFGVFRILSGGGGGGGGYGGSAGGGAGGAGSYPLFYHAELTPGDVITAVIGTYGKAGAGGTAGSVGAAGGDGGPSYVSGTGVYIYLPGASGGAGGTGGAGGAAATTYTETIIGTQGPGSSGAGQITAGLAADNALKTIFVTTPATGGTASSGSSNRGQPGGGGGSGILKGGNGGNGSTAGNSSSSTAGSAPASNAYGAGGGGGASNISSAAGKNGGRGAVGQIIVYWLGNPS